MHKHKRKQKTVKLAKFATGTIIASPLVAMLVYANTYLTTCTKTFDYIGNTPCAIAGVSYGLIALIAVAAIGAVLLVLSIVASRD